MAKFIKTYCKECGKETIHEVYTENAYGASSTMGKVVTTIISMGMCWLDTETFYTCTSCGRKKLIK